MSVATRSSAYPSDQMDGYAIDVKKTYETFVRMGHSPKDAVELCKATALIILADEVMLINNSIQDFIEKYEPPCDEPQWYTEEER